MPEWKILDKREVERIRERYGEDVYSVLLKLDDKVSALDKRTFGSIKIGGIKI